MKAVDLRAPINDPVFALVYGGSGTGKTDLCGTLGALGNTLVIDIDKGSKTIRTSPRVKPYLNNIIVVDFERFGDLNTAYKVLGRNDPDEMSKLFETTVGTPFDWVVWDSWSELQWNMLTELRQKEKLDAGDLNLDFRKNIQIQHWGMLTDLNKLSIESLRGLRSINQVFIMLETMSKDELSGTIFGGPAIHGKMVQEMPGYFDVVVHTYTDPTGKYCCSTKSKGRWPAKTRLGSGVDKAGATAKELFTVQ